MGVLELGAKKFHEQRTTGPLLFESARAPPSAGFNVTFEDLALDTAAGAPLIFARLTAVRTGAYVALELLSRRVTWGRVTLTSILARRRVCRGSGEGAGGVFKQPHRTEIFAPPPPPPRSCSGQRWILISNLGKVKREVRISRRTPCITPPPSSARVSCRSYLSFLRCLQWLFLELDQFS